MCVPPQHERVGVAPITEEELSLVLHRETAVATGLAARAAAEALLTGGPLPAAPSPTRKRGRRADTPTPVGGPVGISGSGYQFLYRKTSSLVGSVTADEPEA